MIDWNECEVRGCDATSTGYDKGSDMHLCDAHGARDAEDRKKAVDAEWNAALEAAAAILDGDAAEASKEVARYHANPDAVSMDHFNHWSARKAQATEGARRIRALKREVKP